MSEVEILTAAKNLLMAKPAFEDQLAVPHKITSGEPARDVNGRRVNPDASGAVLWSPIGAMSRFAKATLDLSKVIALFCKANDFKNERAIVDWNNGPKTTYEDVITAFDKAIELAAKVVIVIPEYPILNPSISLAAVKREENVVP